MRRIPACAALLLSAALVVGQQPQNPGQNAPSGTPPVTYPGDGTQPRQANPQDFANVQNQSELQGVLRACAALLAAATSASCPGEASQQQQDQQPQPQPTPQANPQDKAGVNSQIQSDLQSSLKSDPVLSGTDLQVSVDDVNITLAGSVQSQGQMDRVMALTSPYARYRNVVNKVAIH
jgi:osmotically-inducible protein OsmY